MNSERVKKIKKDIEICMKSLNCNGCSHHSQRSGECCRNLTNDILTYINELESENERLSDELELQQMTDKAYKYNMACENGKQFKQISELKEENTKLKDRIAELEKGNEILRKHNIGYHIANNYEAQDQLKQFAEKLKEKCEFNRKEYCCDATVSARDIDETLKEFEECN